MSISIFYFTFYLFGGCVRTQRTPPAYRRGQMRSAAGPTHCGRPPSRNGVTGPTSKGKISEGSEKERGEERERDIT